MKNINFASANQVVGHATRIGTIIFTNGNNGNIKFTNTNNLNFVDTTPTITITSNRSLNNSEFVEEVNIEVAPGVTLKLENLASLYDNINNINFILNSDYMLKSDTSEILLISDNESSFSIKANTDINAKCCPVTDVTTTIRGIFNELTTITELSYDILSDNAIEIHYPAMLIKIRNGQSFTPEEFLNHCDTNVTNVINANFFALATICKTFTIDDMIIVDAISLIASYLKFSDILVTNNTVTESEDITVNGQVEEIFDEM